MTHLKSISETAVLTALNESLQIFQKSIELRLNATTSNSQMAQVDDLATSSVENLQLLHVENSALLGALKKGSDFQSLDDELETLDDLDINQETVDLIKAMMKHFTLCIQPMLQPQKNLDVFEILAMVQYEQTKWIESYAEDESKYAAIPEKSVTEIFNDAFGST